MSRLPKTKMTKETLDVGSLSAIKIFLPVMLLLVMSRISQPNIFPLSNFVDIHIPGSSQIQVQPPPQLKYPPALSRMLYFIEIV